jgi:transcriptional regulator NrdR family protein
MSDDESRETALALYLTASVSRRRCEHESARIACKTAFEELELSLIAILNRSGARTSPLSAEKIVALDLRTG